MANTVYGPFTATPITNGVTPINKSWGDNAQLQAAIALNGINPLLSGPFVYSGIACTKDGVTANQLDIASGVAFITMSDGSTGQIVVSADNTHTTSTPSTTYYLFLKNDGTWQWSTTSTGPANSLPICHATTDGSGNISVVTDDRASAGYPGVPLTVFHLKDRLITSTAATNLGGPTPVYTGLYRATAYFWYSNPVQQKPTFQVFWTDPTTGFGTASSFMILSGGVSGQILNGSQANTIGNNLPVSCAPVTFYAKGGVQIVFVFTDPGGTPNDTLQCLVERLT